MAIIFTNFDLTATGTGTSANPYNYYGMINNVGEGDDVYARGSITLSASFTDSIGFDLRAWDVSAYGPWRIDGSDGYNFRPTGLIGYHNGIINQASIYIKKASDNCYIYLTNDYGSNYITSGTHDRLAIVSDSLNDTRFSNVDTVYLNNSLYYDLGGLQIDVLAYGLYVDNLVTNFNSSAAMINNMTGVYDETDVTYSATFNSVPSWDETDLGLFNLGFADNAPLWTLPRTFYADFEAGIGSGTSASPWSFSQTRNFVSNQSVGEISARDNDIVRCKGNVFTMSDNLFVNFDKNLRITSWEDGVPWSVDPLFGMELDPLDDISGLDFTLENGIVQNLTIGSTGGPYGGSACNINFKNMIFYGVETSFGEDQDYDLNFYGCTFVDNGLLAYWYSSVTSGVASIYVYDSIFTEDAIDDDNENWAVISAVNCVFTGSQSEVSALTSATATIGLAGYTDCIYGWDLGGQTYPTFDVGSAMPRSAINFEDYNLTVTSATRSDDWIANGIDVGLWNSTRIGAGDWDFDPPEVESSSSESSSSESSSSESSSSESSSSESSDSSESSSSEDDYYGHIGAFYFGPIEASVTATPMTYTVSLLQPTVVTTSPTSATVNNPPVMEVNYFMLPPTSVLATVDITIDFVGVPRIGVSPLTVDFEAFVTFGGEYQDKYIVTEYQWYFDFERFPAVYETSTGPTITHIYSGYAGQYHDVRLGCTIGVK